MEFGKNTAYLTLAIPFSGCVFCADTLDSPAERALSHLGRGLFLSGQQSPVHFVRPSGYRHGVFFLC